MAVEKRDVLVFYVNRYLNYKEYYVATTLEQLNKAIDLVPNFAEAGFLEITAAIRIAKGGVLIHTWSRSSNRWLTYLDMSGISFDEMISNRRNWSRIFERIRRARNA